MCHCSVSSSLNPYTRSRLRGMSGLPPLKAAPTTAPNTCPRTEGSFKSFVNSTTWEVLACFSTIDTYRTIANYGLDLPKARNKCLMCMEGEMHGEVDLLNAHVTRWLHRRRARPLWLGRPRRRRGALLHQQARVVIRHLSLRTE